MTNEEIKNTLKSLKSYYNDKNEYCEDGYVGFDDEDNEAIDMAIKALEQPSWIPVSERLPEEYNHVLCQFCMGGMAECYYANNFFHVVGGLRINSDEVVAWMPLPTPYQPPKMMCEED